MIVINKWQLKDLDACISGLKRFIASTKNTECDVNVIDLIGSDVTMSDLLWLAGEILPKKKIAQFAVDCAETVVHLSKHKELSQNCIDAAKAVIENNNETTRDTAYAVAATSYAARVGCVDFADATATYAVAATRVSTARVSGVRATATRAIRAARAATNADDDFNVNPLLVKLFTK